MKLVLATIFVAAVAVPVCAADLLNWTVRPLHLSGTSGWLIALYVTPAGQAHAAGYQTDYPLSTWYANREGGAWSPGTALSGQFDDLALDRDGRPHLLVHTLAADHARYAVELVRLADDGTWERTPVFTRRSTGFSLAFDSLNRPHIGFIDTDAATLNHTYLEGTGWVTEPVASRGSFVFGNAFAKIALDNFDVPHFIWYDFSSDGMEHGVRVGNVYVIRDIGSGFGRSMVFDGFNHLHLAMTVTSQHYPGYARFDGSTWTTEVVDWRFGDEGAIALDMHGHPHIVYGVDRGASQAAHPDKLMHATRAGDAWVLDPITNWPSLGNGAEAQAVQVDAENVIHVVFSDDSKNIYYATTGSVGPDECAAGEGSPDCNDNGVADECDIRDNTSADCNQNGVPDECDIDSGSSTDCQANDVPDECELDCNRNGVFDLCDVNPDDPDGDRSVSDDCDRNSVPDECDPDCNENGRPDLCDVASQFSADCDQDGFPDECQLEDDADADGVLDSCDACPASDLKGTLVIHGCDTGLVDDVDAQGCSFSDQVAACRAEAPNHGAFVGCVVALGRELRAAGQLDAEEFGGLVSCTRAKPFAELDLPHKLQRETTRRTRR